MSEAKRAPGFCSRGSALGQPFTSCTISRTQLVYSVRKLCTRSQCITTSAALHTSDAQPESIAPTTPHQTAC